MLKKQKYNFAQQNFSFHLLFAIVFIFCFQLQHSGNALLHNLVWDQDLKLTAIVTKKADNSFLAQNLGLGYDNNNNITTISDYLDGTRTKTYTYDANYRLTKDAAGKYGTLTYTYDNNSNRSTITDNGTLYDYNYTSGTNRLLNQKQSSTTRESFTYDNSGNTLTDTITAGAITYSYSNWNKLKQLANGINSTTATYKYNGLGQRASKTIGSATTNYVYDTNNHLIAEYNGSTLLREYIYLNDEPLAEVDSSGTLYYIHNDHLNTPQKATNASQSIVFDNITEAFGEPNSLTGSLTNNLRFPGQLFDGEGTLNQNANRYYSYWHGRYTQPDPIGLSGGITVLVKDT